MLRRHQLTWEAFIEKWKRENLEPPEVVKRRNNLETRNYVSQDQATLQEISEDQIEVAGRDNESLNKSSKKAKPLNIRDKTNTYCNECDVTFDTRIQFLGHCSEIHDVKFKGRAGQPLVIPSVEEQERSGSMRSPLRKKARVNVSNLSPNTKKDKDPVPCQVIAQSNCHLDIDFTVPVLR